MCWCVVKKLLTLFTDTTWQVLLVMNTTFTHFLRLRWRLLKRSTPPCCRSPSLCYERLPPEWWCTYHLRTCRDCFPAWWSKGQLQWWRRMQVQWQTPGWCWPISHAVWTSDIWPGYLVQCEWPWKYASFLMCWCAVKKLFTHSLIPRLVEVVDTFRCFSLQWLILPFHAVFYLVDNVVSCENSALKILALSDKRTVLVEFLATTAGAT